MSIVTALTVYAVMWWIVLFVVLPWGVQIPENPEKGHASSAPINPHLGKKFLWTTAIAAVLWLIFFIINRYNLITFR